MQSPVVDVTFTTKARSLFTPPFPVLVPAKGLGSVSLNFSLKQPQDQLTQASASHPFLLLSTAEWMDGHVSRCSCPKLFMGFLNLASPPHSRMEVPEALTTPRKGRS